METTPTPRRRRRALARLSGRRLTPTVVVVAAVALVVAAVVTFAPTTSSTRAPSAAGRQDIEVSAAADGRSSSTIALEVANLESRMGESVLVTATVLPAPGAPVPTGTIAFSEGNGSLEEHAVEDGHATYASAEMAAGVHEIHAAYSGDDVVLPSTSHIVFTVQPPAVDAFGGTGPTIAVVGDSITLGSKNDITAGLHAVRLDPSVIGLYGYTTTSARPFVEAFIAHDPSIVILELGTNDIAEIASGVPDRTAEGLRSRMQALTDSFPNACVAVTTVTTHRRSGSPGIDAARWNELAQEHNRWLRATYRNVVDWDRAIGESAGRGEALVRDDELHPTPAGARTLASLDVLAAARCRMAASA